MFTAGQTNTVEVTVESFNDELTDEVRLLDSCPWEVDETFGDVQSVDGNTVDLGTVSTEELENGPVTRSYFAEAPDTSDRYTFGPAEARAVDPAEYDRVTGPSSSSSVETVPRSTVLPSTD